MPPVVVERRFERPAVADEIHRTAEQGAWCMRAHDLRHALGLLGLDGRRMLCVFEATDAETVRRVNQQIGFAFERAWTATRHGPPPPERPHRALVVVERAFPEPVPFEEIQGREEAGAWCLDRHGVRFVETYFSLDRRRMICLYTAPDAESVRASQATIDMPFDHVWSGLSLAPDAA